MEKKKQTFRDEYYNNLVRTNIIRYRKLYGFTQEELSIHLNIGVSYLSQIESKKSKDNCPIYLLSDISDLFGINIKYFLLDKPPMPKVTNKLNTITHKGEYYYDLIRTNVKRYRIYNGKSQNELSREVQHGHNFISRIETTKQKIDLSDIGRIADVLDISIERFFEE